jgi:hypothetical protein
MQLCRHSAPCQSWPCCRGMSSLLPPRGKCTPCAALSIIVDLCMYNVAAHSRCTMGTNLALNPWSLGQMLRCISQSTLGPGCWQGVCRAALPLSARHPGGRARRDPHPCSAFGTRDSAASGWHGDRGGGCRAAIGRCGSQRHCRRAGTVMKCWLLCWATNMVSDMDCLILRFPIDALTAIYGCVVALQTCADNMSPDNQAQTSGQSQS